MQEDIIYIYSQQLCGGGSSLPTPILLGFCDRIKLHVHLALLSLSHLKYSDDSKHTHSLKGIHFRLLGQCKHAVAEKSALNTVIGVCMLETSLREMVHRALSGEIS